VKVDTSSGQSIGAPSRIQEAKPRVDYPKVQSVDAFGVSTIESRDHERIRSCQQSWSALHPEADILGGSILFQLWVSKRHPGGDHRMPCIRKAVLTL
jgi:hypothetical protein